MKFTKEYLLNLVFEDAGELISDEIVEHTRWSVQHYAIFKYENNFYATNYRVGATEMQDESPYEFEGSEIECDEVVPVEKTITVYKKSINKGGKVV